MTIREATDSDIPEIVDLLKTSLGERQISKSEELWKWKHYSNPFGASPVLLAETQGRIIGVRTFLRWDFDLGEELIQGYRAVDTAIHPDFQRKGIFKTLTLTLIEKSSQHIQRLIFNTPNPQSTPGYLKMGWQKWGKLPLHIGVNLKTNTKPVEKTNWEELQGLITAIEARAIQSIARVKTYMKPGYLNWRYRDCPIAQYQAVSDRKTFLLIYRVKKSKFGNEFRICDLLLAKTLDTNEVNDMNEQIRTAIHRSNCQLVTYSGLQEKEHLTFLPSPKIPVGPLVTLRQLHADFNPFALSWGWSIGDLELF